MSDGAALVLALAILALAAATYFGPYDPARWAERRSRFAARLRVGWARWKRRILWSSGALLVVTIGLATPSLYENAKFEIKRRQVRAVEAERIANIKQRPAFQTCVADALRRDVARRPDYYDSRLALALAQVSAERDCMDSWRADAIRRKAAELMAAEDIDLASLEIVERMGTRLDYADRAENELREAGEID